MAGPNQVAEQAVIANHRTKRAADQLAGRFGRAECVPHQMGWDMDGRHDNAVLAVSIAELAEAMVKLTAEVDELKAALAAKDGE